MNLASHIIVRPSNMANALIKAAERSIINAPSYQAIPWTAKRVVDRTERGQHVVKEFGITLPKRDGEGKVAA